MKNLKNCGPCDWWWRDTIHVMRCGQYNGGWYGGPWHVRRLFRHFVFVDVVMRWSYEDLSYDDYDKKWTLWTIAWKLNIGHCHEVNTGTLRGYVHPVFMDLVYRACGPCVPNCSLECALNFRVVVAIVIFLSLAPGVPAWEICKDNIDIEFLNWILSDLSGNVNLSSRLMLM